MHLPEDLRRSPRPHRQGTRSLTCVGSGGRPYGVADAPVPDLRQVRDRLPGPAHPCRSRPWPNPEVPIRWPVTTLPGKPVPPGSGCPAVLSDQSSEAGRQIRKTDRSGDRFLHRELGTRSRVLAEMTSMATWRIRRGTETRSRILIGMTSVATRGIRSCLSGRGATARKFFSLLSRGPAYRRALLELGAHA
jgi:hypothetical protein